MADEFVDDIVHKYRVVMFSKSNCPECAKAQVIFDHYHFKKGDYQYVDLDKRDDGNEIQDCLEKLTGARTVPRIFIDGQFYGGCDELIKGEKLEDFDQHLNDASIHFEKKPMH